MDVRELRMFVAAAEAHSIRAGARHLFVTQPYMSQCLRKLERELGVDLFVRSPRGVVVTQAGQVLLVAAHDILARVDRVASEVREMVSARQTVRVGLMVGRVAAADLTASILTTFKAAYPNIDIEVRELSFVEQFDAFTDEDVDVAIVRPPGFEGALTVEPLFVEPRLLCVKRDHELADAPSLSAADFIDQPFLDLLRPQRQWSAFWQLNELRGANADVCDSGAVTLSELQATLLCEDAVITVASSAWRLGLSHPMLRAIPIEDIPPSEVAVAFREGENRGSVLAFAECARKVSSELLHLVPGGAPAR